MSEKMETEDTRCGLFHFRPNILQPCANISCFAVAYFLVFLLTSSTVVYIDSQITTLERDFGFSSSQTGILVAANDVGFLVVSVFLGYMASRVHIPRFTGASSLLFGVSAVICSLPHFIFADRHTGRLPLPVTLNVTTPGNVSAENSVHNNLCSTRNYSAQTCHTEEGQRAQDFISPGHIATVSLVIMFVGMFLQGVIKASRVPFLVYYVDNNTAKENMGFVVGCIYVGNFLGPAIAFSLGGVFSRIFVTLQATGLNPRHPDWIGAWWLGFLVFGLLSMLTSLPISCFPQKLGQLENQEVKDPLTRERLPADKAGVMKGKNGDNKNMTRSRSLHKPDPKRSRTDGSVSDQVAGVAALVKDFMNTLIRLLINPVCTLCLMSVCIIIFVLSAAKTFGPKYLETMFGVQTSTANYIISVQTLVAGVTGNTLGGYLTKRFRMTARQALRFVMVASSLGVLCTVLAFFPACDQPTVHNWPGSPNNCSSECNCEDNNYFPVCGEDGRTYYSPCQAGCNQTENGVYSNCSCIPGGEASPGTCDYSCVHVYLYSVVSALATFFSTVIIMPITVVFARIVLDKDVGSAFGVKGFLMSLLVLDRGPVLYGVIEIQESYNEEEGLKSAWEKCRKKGGHDKYIAVNDFQVNDLPEGFQDEQLVDLVKALSKLTVRIQVTELSPNRPEKYPVNTRDYPRYLMVGSGCITKVLQTGRPCLCRECRRMKAPRWSFCELYITTVTHVVYDDTEAENAICRLGYDTETSTTEMLYGLEVLDGHVDGDLCAMKYIVHEEQFALKLQQLWNDYDNVRHQVNKKYVGIDNRLAIVVGHPHGMCKHVSVGEWTERFPMCHDPYFAQYRYTTSTCSGSSGSPVILPGRDSGWWFTPAHSSWDDTNTGLNISAVVYDPHVPYVSDSSVSDQ